jgi:hypothetical protein
MPLAVQPLLPHCLVLGYPTFLPCQVVPCPALMFGPQEGLLELLGCGRDRGHSGSQTVPFSDLQLLV